MKTLEPSAIPPDVLSGLEQAVAAAMSGGRDVEAMRRTAERMDRMREEIRSKHGVLDVCLGTFRELRG